MKRLTLTIAALSLSACAEEVSRVFEYEARATDVQMPDGGYRVLEHPTEDVLMTTLSLERSAAHGFALGAVLPGQPAFEAATRKHMDNTNRASCGITGGFQLVPSQYEFSYTC